jgi:dipeptidyl aminopeptidase/acylaminoacyl peptidase
MGLTAELVVDGRVPSSPALSPDGRWVAYVETPVGRSGEHTVSRLWVTAVGGDTAPSRLEIPSAHLTGPRWMPDSEWILFLSDHATRGRPQLHRVGRAGGAVEVLTRWRTGIQGYRPLAGSPLVAVMAAHEERDRTDVEVRGRVRPARLHLLDPRTGRTEVPARFGDRHVVDAVQRPDGGPVAVLTWSTPDLDPGLVHPALHLLDLSSGRVRDLGPVPAGARSPVWWQDEGWHLSYLALTPPGLHAGTAVFDLASPGAEPGGAHRNLTAGMPACPMELVQVDEGTPLVLVADGLDTTIHRCTVDGLAELSRTRGLVEHLSANRGGDVIAAVVSRADEPHDVLAGPVQGPLARRTDTRPELRDIRWGSQERLSYRASDGLALDGLLILPPDRDPRDGPFPLVTIVHGGPDDRYADEFMLHWAPSGQWLAHAGHAVFLPNPRGGQGHGHDFAASVAGAVGQEEWTDILTGIDLLVARGVADPARLGIAGWSHGGFMAAWAVSQINRFAAAVVGAGISDWGLQAAAGEWGAFEAALGGSTGWEGPGPHRHDRLSPISHASAIRTPVLIVHGAEDTNVPLSQAEYLHRALRHFGVEHEFVIYPRENHSLLERNHQLDLLHRTRSWFDRWLQPSTAT